MPPKKPRTQTEAVPDIPVTCRRGGDARRERKMLLARYNALLYECDDFWSGKRGKHSHVHPIFKEYWRLVQIARDIHPGDPIFDELDISEAAQPNADDIQAIEMDIRKMLAVFGLDEREGTDRPVSHRTISSEPEAVRKF